MSSVHLLIKKVYFSSLEAGICSRKFQLQMWRKMFQMNEEYFNKTRAKSWLRLAALVN